MAPAAATVYTVGHGTRTIADLVAVLRGADIVRLVDVRRFPASRRHPHLAREPLAEALAEAGVAYEWQGEALGGRRSRTQRPSRHPALRNQAFQGYAEHMETTEFREALERLENRAREGETLAVMCAETLWWRCHRRLIADAVALDGISVLHLLAARRAEPHALHPAVRHDESGYPVYDSTGGDHSR